MLPPNIERSNSHEASVLGYILGLKTTIWKTVLCKTQLTADCASHKTQDAFLGDIVILDTCDPNKHWANYLSIARVNLFTKKKNVQIKCQACCFTPLENTETSVVHSCWGNPVKGKGVNSSAIAHCGLLRTPIAPFWPGDRFVVEVTGVRAVSKLRRFWLLKCCDWRFWLAVKRIGTILHVAPPHGIATNQNKSWNTHKRRNKKRRETNTRQTEKKQMEIGRITTERRETKTQKWDQHTRNDKHREQKVKN